MQTALVSEPGETVCSFFVGPKTPRNLRDWSKSNGAVGVRSPASVYKFNPRFPNKYEFVHHGWVCSESLYLPTSRPVIFHLSCCPFSNIGAVQSRHHVKAHIDTRRDASRGDDMSLVDNTCICHHFYGGRYVAHPSDTISLRCGSLGINQSAVVP